MACLPGRGFRLSDIDTNHLIQLVEERPCLWNRSISLYQNRAYKAKAWRDVCSILNPTYESLQVHFQNQYAKAVLNKWTNLRDCWMKVTQMSGKKNGKTFPAYIYQDQLVFLKQDTQSDKLANVVDALTEEIERSFGTSSLIAEVEDTDKRRRVDDNFLTINVLKSRSGINPEPIIVNPMAVRSSKRKRKPVQKSSAMVTIFADNAMEVKQEPQDIQDDCPNGATADEGPLPQTPLEPEVAAAVSVEPTLEFDATVPETEPPIKTVELEPNVVPSSRIVENECRYLSFFKGILPSLQSLNDDECLEFQSGVIHLVQSIKRSSSGNYLGRNF